MRTENVKEPERMMRANPRSCGSITHCSSCPTACGERPEPKDARASNETVSGALGETAALRREKCTK